MSALLESLMNSSGLVGVEAPAKRVKALAWARVSTDMQEERGLSMPEQLRQIREYAEQNGIDVVAEYQEAASAFQHKVRRVEFERMIERAKADKQITAILVHDYSRFSRDSLGARLLVRELQQAGVRVISLNDMEVDTESVAGVYMEAITFAKNEAYSREVAFHTKKGCRANVQARDPETGWCYKNGGQPLFGYRSERLIRGEEKKGRPIIKSIWVPNDTVVNGKPISEWAKDALEMAANGATLDQLRDFCNDNGIPAPRSQYWGSTTWHSLLHPNCLLEYAGYGVWNVRGKHQRMNPPEEWIIVENAHPALITEDEAKLIMELRRRRPAALPVVSGARARSKDSRFLLSGGLFKCGKCGSNMAGFTSTNGRGRKGDYYVCGSAQYRRSLGCGPGVYVDKNLMENAVLQGIAERFEEWSDTARFTRLVNKAISDLHRQSVGAVADIAGQVGDVDGKIANVRKAVEGGLQDVGWANTRLRELSALRAELVSRQAATGYLTEKPVLDVSAIRSYQGRLRELLGHAENAECRDLVRCFVNGINLRSVEQHSSTQTEPGAHEIIINFKAIPAQFVKGLGAGVGFEPTTFGL